MTDTTPDPLQDRFRGALLGTFVGDALGMPVEGWSADAIESHFGQMRDFQDARLGAGTYTDDTQLMIALAEGLLQTSRGEPPNLDEIAERFARRYDPERGYGGNARRILQAFQDGELWRDAVESRLLPGGSFANGAAMRVAPVALAYYPDPKGTESAAAFQAELTGHTHPEGIFGARLLARAVLRAIETGTRGESFDGPEFVHEMVEDAPEPYRQPLVWIADRLHAEPHEAIRALGVGGRAVQSVPAALWAFLSSAGDPEEATIRAVGLGGDTDTIGAMAGALAFGHHGASALPERWWNGLETEETHGEPGRDAVVELADRFWKRVG